MRGSRFRDEQEYRLLMEYLQHNLQGFRYIEVVLFGFDKTFHTDGQDCKEPNLEGITPNSDDSSAVPVECVMFPLQFWLLAPPGIRPMASQAEPRISRWPRERLSKVLRRSFKRHMKQSTWYQVDGSGPLHLTRAVRPNLPPKSFCKYWPWEDVKESRALLRFQHIDEMPDQHFLLLVQLGVHPWPDGSSSSEHLCTPTVVKIALS